LSKTDTNHFESSLQFDSIYIRFEYWNALMESIFQQQKIEKIEKNRKK
jgi:hypothetical protein